MVMSLALILSTQRKKRSSKAIRRRQRGDDLVAPEIPLDLQIEILIRLPMKSLIRFKCVSKLWSSIIHSRCFSNGYLRAASTPRLYISSVEHIDCGLMDLCQNPGKSALLSLSLSSSETAFDFDLTMQGIGGHNMVVLRGLILYTVCRQACVYNPTTGQRVTLPAVESNFFTEVEIKRYAFYFLGHDPVLDQYKVVCNEVILSVDFETIDAQYWVFVMEAGGSWKRIEFDQPHLPTRLGLCINGVIYYLAESLVSRDCVFSFDVRSEEFNMIIAPELGESVGFIEYGGKPTLFDYTHLGNTGLVDLWVLEDSTSWSRKSLVLQPCQKHLVDNNIDLWVVGTTQKGEIILVPRTMDFPDYILCYDLHKNDLRKVEIRGIPDHQITNPYYLHFTLMDTEESIMRLQT